jgi:hypothetical protein
VFFSVAREKFKTRTPEVTVCFNCIFLKINLLVAFQIIVEQGVAGNIFFREFKNKI